jgi:hypothetical protein
LTVSNVDEEGVVYRNDAWMPARALVATGDANVQVDGTDPRTAATRSEPAGVAGVDAPAGRTDAIGPGTLLWSEAADAHWTARAGGQPLEHRQAFGWTNAFVLDRHAPVHVHFSGNRLVGASRVAAFALWVVVLVCWFATRRRVAADEDDGELEALAGEPDASREETPVGA